MADLQNIDLNEADPREDFDRAQKEYENQMSDMREYIRVRKMAKKLHPLQLSFLIFMTILWSFCGLVLFFSYFHPTKNFSFSIIDPLTRLIF